LVGGTGNLSIDGAILSTNRDRVKRADDRDLVKNQ
jgi:hypothetical protein